MSKDQDRKYRRLHSSFLLYQNKVMVLNIWNDYLIGNFTSDQLLFHSMRINEFLVEKLEIFNTNSVNLFELKAFLNVLEKSLKIEFYLEFDDVFDETVDTLIYGFDTMGISENEFKIQLTEIRNCWINKSIYGRS